MRALLIPVTLAVATGLSSAAMATTVNYSQPSPAPQKSSAAVHHMAPARHVMMHRQHHSASTQLMARLEKLHEKIMSGKKSGQLNKHEYRQVMNDYGLVRHSIRAASSSNEMSAQRYWNLNGQLNYLSRQIARLSSNAARA